jgi:putative transposase
MEHGIKEFIRKLTSSFSHYYNKKYETSGPLFTGNFKAVRIEDEDQLIHLSRYIHLNPVTSRIVERPEDYIYSSYKSFLKKEKVNILRPEVIIGDMSPIEYEKFVLNQINYQRQLKEIRHLLIE